MSDEQPQGSAKNADLRGQEALNAVDAAADGDAAGDGDAAADGDAAIAVTDSAMNRC